MTDVRNKNIKFSIKLSKNEEYMYVTTKYYCPAINYNFRRWLLQLWPAKIAQLLKRWFHFTDWYRHTRVRHRWIAWWTGGLHDMQSGNIQADCMTDWWTAWHAGGQHTGGLHDGLVDCTTCRRATYRRIAWWTGGLDDAHFGIIQAECLIMQVIQVEGTGRVQFVELLLLICSTNLSWQRSKSASRSQTSWSRG